MSEKPLWYISTDVSEQYTPVCIPLAESTDHLRTYASISSLREAAFMHIPSGFQFEPFMATPTQVDQVVEWEMALSQEEFAMYRLDGAQQREQLTQIYTTLPRRSDEVAFEVSHPDIGSVGLIACNNISPMAKFGELALLIGEKDHRGKKIGSTVMTVFLTRLQHFGFNKLGVDYMQGNPASRRLMRKFPHRELPTRGPHAPERMIIELSQWQSPEMGAVLLEQKKSV